MFQSITEPIIFPLTQEQRDRLPEYQKALSIFVTEVSIELYEVTQTPARIEIRVEGVPSVGFLDRLMELKCGETVLFSDVEQSGFRISSGFSANSSFGIVFGAYPGDRDMLPKLTIIERPQDLTRVKMTIWVYDPDIPGFGCQ